jgi:hypothetical protein
MSRSDFRFASIIAFMLIFSACSKDDDNFLNKLVVDQIVYHENINQIGKYVYNGEGRVIRYEYYFNDNLVEYTVFALDGGKLKSKTTYSLGNDGKYMITSKDLMEYNSSGQLIKMTNSLGDRYVTNYTFTYDADRIGKVAYTSPLGDDQTVVTYFLIEYDANGNAKKQTYHSVSDGSDVLTSTVIYEFDDKLNPRFDINDPYDMFNYNDKNRNNVTKIIHKSANDEVILTKDITYTYNEDKFPITRTEETVTNGSPSSSIIKFTYKKI